MSFSLDAARIKCPSCNHVETILERSSSSLKRARVLKTLQTAIAHDMEKEEEEPKRKKRKKKKEKRLHAFRSWCPEKIQ